MSNASNIPRATYRLQFHRGFTLRNAQEIVPYLSALGISHVYASPLLKAQTGSTHGYDVCDTTQINPEIGTEAELETFVAALRERGMGLVLDIVPNHMAAVAENPWWWDVLKRGPKSQFAEHFDIDWKSPNGSLRGKVLLPVLGDEYERVLERGELKVACEDGVATVRYFDHHFPVSPESLPTSPAALHKAIIELSADRKALARFLDQQHYRLAFWRHGDTQLNYRRFFTITHLAGVRVELPQVFKDTHSRILDWHKRGLIDGLRVDHPDGLHDPKDYLSSLSKAAPGAWIVVEKIIEPGEDLPADWPVDGTTGYEFLARVGELFIDPSSEKPLTEFYGTFTGEPTDCPALVREKKRWILRHQLATEVSRLVGLLVAIRSARSVKDVASSEVLRDALVELIACFPVYRTYAQAGKGPLSRTDKTWISSALAQAAKAQPAPSPAALAFLNDLLQLNLPGELENEFVMRFQQLTGPAMAKGVEDTTFYCFNRFVALNEVGGDPAHFGLSVEEFHRACGQALEQWPNAMLASTTHDTKRSEDVRSRLALLSEIPDEWAAAVRRWSVLNEKHHRNNLPDRNAEYLFYQTVVGAWPLPVDRAHAYMEKASREAKQHTNWTDGDAAYDDALKSFVTSALGDKEFLADLERFVAPLIEPGQINSLAQTLLKLTAPGVPDIYQGTELWDSSLVDPDNRRPVDFEKRQRLLAELTQLSLHHPDAREVLDCAGPLALSESRDGCESGRGLPQSKTLARSPTTRYAPEWMEQVWQRHAEGLPKLWLIQQALQFRRDHAELFGAQSRYEPLVVQGSKSAHVIAFARIHGKRAVLTVAPRLPLRLSSAKDLRPSLIQPSRQQSRAGFQPAPDRQDACPTAAFTGSDAWQDTRLVLPNDWRDSTWRNILTGEELAATHHLGTTSLPLADVLAHFPVALLEETKP